MTLTYGEQMLAQAEARAGAHTARRRQLTLQYPALAAAAWALADLVAARHGRLAGMDAGAFRYIVDHLMPITWTVLFVLAPIVLATKRDALPAGAALAFVAGPLLSPMLFGAGGWKWWQITVVLLLAIVVVGAAAQSARKTPA